MGLNLQALAVLGDRREELGLGKVPLTLRRVGPQGDYSDTHAYAYADADADTRIEAA